MPLSTAELALRHWAESGAMALTGRADGPPLVAHGAAASAARHELDALAAVADLGTVGPGHHLLGERAALAGHTRRAPWSAGGAFRILPASDGWVGFSLARTSDLAAVAALTERSVTDPWNDLERWLAVTPAAVAVQRAILLGLAAAAIEPGVRAEGNRPGVVATAGEPRSDRGRQVPLVVDLSSLWAGPLCAHLLGLIGADVVKVESTGRPDGARQGNREFFDLLHTGHRAVALDFGSDEDRIALARLVASADVVIEASRPRALRQLGIEVQDSIQTGTLWISITAYGRQPECENRVGFGDDVAAGAGLVAWDGDTPVPAGDALADPLAGLCAAAAAVRALAERRGGLLDVSMYDVARAAYLIAPTPALPAEAVEVCVPRSRTAPGRAPRVGEHTKEIVATLP